MMKFASRNDPDTLALITDRGTRFSTYAYVPREVVVTSPEVVTPIHTARVYRPGLWLLEDGRTVNYSVLCKLPDFRGTSNYPQLHIYEWWRDYGDDGHTEYSLMGYLWSIGPVESETVRHVDEIVWSLEDEQEGR